MKSAGIAQLVERNLAKVEVASSSLVSRSNFKDHSIERSPRCIQSNARKKSYGAVAEWLCTGLQIRERRFDSDPRLQLKAHQRCRRIHSPASRNKNPAYARVVK
jgi:hypothetical protein